MHILIAEKNLNGRRILNRMLKMEGYRVSVAESGSQALNLLKETRPDIVLMNVFQCMYSPGALPEGKISVSRHVEATLPVLLVACSRGGENLAEFMNSGNQYGDAAFDLLPARVKSEVMNKIQQLCAALRLSSRASLPGAGFNWQRFVSLMGWNPALEM